MDSEPPRQMLKDQQTLPCTHTCTRMPHTCLGRGLVNSSYYSPTSAPYRTCMKQQGPSESRGCEQMFAAYCGGLACKESHTDVLRSIHRKQARLSAIPSQWPEEDIRERQHVTSVDVATVTEQTEILSEEHTGVQGVQGRWLPARQQGLVHIM